MIHIFFSSMDSLLSTGIAVLLSMIFSFVLLSKSASFLPLDRGREYAFQASESIGKPTGAGLVFISSTLFVSAIFLPLNLPIILFYLAIAAAMFFGYLDDRAQKPWHEYKKAILDLLVSFGTAYVFAYFLGTEIILPFTGQSVTVPFFVFVLLATLLVWVSINVTNCSDGVDGLSASLSVISICAFVGLSLLHHTLSVWSSFSFIAVGSLLVYLWFNTHPSALLMGDAGSRAVGIILAISALYTHNPLSYVFICLIFILDGGAGIAKISLKRFLGLHILKRVRTPLHDHFRESKDPNQKHSGKWKNQTVTARFSLMHIFLCGVYIFIEAIVLSNAC